MRVWAVLDKSKADLPYYDVLYFDRNANGDLTDPGERFIGTYNQAGEAGSALTIRIGDFQVPGTDLVHTNLEVSTVPKKGRHGVWFCMKWNGREKISGGYDLIGSENTTWSPTPKAAPVLRPTVHGPFSFGIYTWGAKDAVLTIGRAKRVCFLVGNRGSGTDTFCAVSENFLVPGKDYLVATLIAKDKDGKEVTIRNDIKAHC